MISAINSALSGLAAATTRLAVSANNIVNQSSTQSMIDGQVVNQPYTPQQVQQVSLDTGGVMVQIRDVNPATMPVYNPSDPQADAHGVVQMPNVDLSNELVAQTMARYDFEANLKTIKTANNMLTNLLNILS